MVKVSDMIPKRVVDQTAETIEEIHAQHQYVGSKQIWQMVTEGVKSGKFEQVWKKVGSRTIRAYRPIKKKK